MKAFLLGLVVAGAALTAGCVGTWEHGGAWESRSSEAPEDSPYMPTVNDYEKLVKAKHNSWVEVHVTDRGHVGYLMTEVTGIHDIGGPEKLYYVYNIDLERIGFFTKLGSTYRYEFDDYKQTKKFIGHYEVDEAVAHLLRVPVSVQLKALSVKPPKF